MKGKQLFVPALRLLPRPQPRGHQGPTGPNLDAAFARARQDGFGTAAIRGIVYKQILYPNRTGVMPAKLVKGQNAHDVAAYVGHVAATPGKDTGALAGAGQAQQKPLATAKGGTLEIPADPTGQLLYVYKNAAAPAGKLTINSPNKSRTPHDISVQGKATGKEVKGGGVSTISVDLTPGKYQFLSPCPAMPRRA